MYFFFFRETYENIFNMFQQLLDVKEVDKSDPKSSCERLMQKYIEVSIGDIFLHFLLFSEWHNILLFNQKNIV